MTIGVVTTSYPRFAGDYAGSFVGEHVAWLRAAGHAVEVIAAGDSAAVGSGAGVTRIPSPPGLFYSGGAPDVLERRPHLAWKAAGFCLRSTARIARAKWDAVIGHWLVPAALAAIAKPGRPVIAIAHSGDVDWLCKRGLATAVTSLLFVHGAKLSFVADHLRVRLASSVARPLRQWVLSAQVAPMGIDVRRIAGERRPPGAPVRRIVFLGRLVPIKGVDVLCRAMPAMSKRAEVVVAGDGPLAERVADSASKCGARFVGRVEGGRRDELLRSADIVVMPSVEVEGRREGAPVTALEAMAAGAAVVASKTGGLAELPADVARHVEPGSAEALVRAVTELIDGALARREQVARARLFVESRDWERVGPLLMPPEAPRARVRKPVRGSA